MEKLLCLKAYMKETGTFYAWIVTSKIKAFYYIKKENRTYICVDESAFAYWFPGDLTDKIRAAVGE